MWAGGKNLLFGSPAFGSLSLLQDQCQIFLPPGGTVPHFSKVLLNGTVFFLLCKHNETALLFTNFDIICKLRMITNVLVLVDLQNYTSKLD